MCERCCRHVSSLWRHAHQPSRVIPVDESGLFAQLTFDDARHIATERDLLVVVDGWADWCGPCKLMDRTTWTDPTLQAWLHDHAITLKVDTGMEKSFASEHRISGLPVVIVFHDGREIARTAGYRRAPDLLAWLKGVSTS